MKNVYGDWEGYLDRLRQFEASSQPEPLFPLPNGKTMGEASPEEIEEFRAIWEEHQGIVRDEDWTGRSEGAPEA